MLNRHHKISRQKRLVRSTALLLFILGQQAAAVDNEPNAAKYVSINVEIKELKEAGAKLNDSAQVLADSVKNVSQNMDDLSPEQIREVNELAKTANLLAQNLRTGIESIPKTISESEGPAQNLLNKSLEQARISTIDPVVAAIDRWVLITIIGLVLLGLALAIALFFALKGMKYLSLQLKAVTEGYRIVPVEQLKEIQINDKGPES